jgi:hypothetical protein
MAEESEKISMDLLNLEVSGAVFLQNVWSP